MYKYPTALKISLFFCFKNIHDTMMAGCIWGDDIQLFFFFLDENQITVELAIMYRINAGNEDLG